VETIETRIIYFCATSADC